MDQDYPPAQKSRNIIHQRRDVREWTRFEDGLLLLAEEAPRNTEGEQ